MIGHILVSGIKEENNRAEVGYILHPDRWNQGLMSESLRAVIDYLLDEKGFDGVEAYHHHKNPASGRVMEKSGMVLEEVVPRGVWSNGGISDKRKYVRMRKGGRR